MANTRYNYDSSRVSKKLQESNDIEEYMLNTPGNGTRPTFIADPHIIPQKWGGNLATNPTQIESALFGIKRPLCRGDYISNTPIVDNVPNYPIDNKAFTIETRYLTPAWEIRNVSIPRWDYLPVNPQLHSTIKFANNMDTRNTIKDYYLYKV